MNNKCKPHTNQSIWLKRVFVNVNFVIAIQLFYEMYIIFAPLCLFDTS